MITYLYVGSFIKYILNVWLFLDNWDITPRREDSCDLTWSVLKTELYTSFMFYQCNWYRWNEMLIFRTFSPCVPVTTTTTACFTGTSRASWCRPEIQLVGLKNVSACFPALLHDLWSVDWEKLRIYAQARNLHTHIMQINILCLGDSVGPKLGKQNWF